ncbi:glycosyltransferase 87 family protein [Streptomyces sp. NPDC054796]
MSQTSEKKPVRSLGIWLLYPLLLSAVYELTNAHWHIAPADHRVDIKIYRAAVDKFLDGTNPYPFEEWGTSFTYPPFALLLLVPLTLASLAVTSFLWTALGIAAMQGVVYRVLRTTGAPYPLRITLVATPLLLLYYPVDLNLHWGNLSILLMALVVFDLKAPDTARYKGVLLGAAIGIKLFPGIFVLHYVVTRRWRAAGVSLATAVATMGVGWIVMPGYATYYWKRVLDVDRIIPAGWLPNESLRATLERAFHSDGIGALLVVSTVVLAALVIATSVMACRLGEEDIGIAVIALAAVLFSPVSWHHYWVWTIPVTIIICGVAARWRSAFLWISAGVATAVIAARVNMWFLPDPPFDAMKLSAFEAFTTSIVTYVGVCLVVALFATVCLRHRSGLTQDRADSPAPVATRDEVRSEK